MTTANLLPQIERFLKRNRMSKTRFGYLTLGDPGFVQSLRSGREPRPSTVEKLRRFMAGAGA